MFQNLLRSKKNLNNKMDGIKIKGIMKTSLIDYPGNIVATVFLSRCNFRCPFCHNPELVLDEVKDDIPSDEFLDFLKKRKKWLDGVCITGGEPTLHSGLKDFIIKIKNLDMKVKLDTNGTNPDMVKELIDEGLVDQVAMDIKASFDKYEDVTKVKVDIEKIKESIELLKKGKTDYVFRTTVVPKHFDEKEAQEIGKIIKGAKKYVLQQFRSADKMLENEYHHIEPYLSYDLEKFKKIIEEYVDEVEIRGIE